MKNIKKIAKILKENDWRVKGRAGMYLEIVDKEDHVVASLPTPEVVLLVDTLKKFAEEAKTDKERNKWVIEMMRLLHIRQGTSQMFSKTMYEI